MNLMSWTFTVDKTPVVIGGFPLYPVLYPARCSKGQKAAKPTPAGYKMRRMEASGPFRVLFNDVKAKNGKRPVPARA